MPPKQTFLIVVGVGAWTALKWLLVTTFRLPEYLLWLDIAIVASLFFILPSRQTILRNFVGFLAAWIQLKYWLIAILQLPEAIKWADDAILLVLFAGICMNAALTQRLIRSPIGGIIALSVGIAFISIVLNNVPILVGLVGLRAFGRYFLLYYLLLWLPIDRRALRLFISVTLWTSLIQVILAVVQFTGGLSSAPTSAGFWQIPDQVFGTFGAGTANHFGYYCLMLIFLAMIIAMMDRSYRRYFLFVPLLSVPWVLSSAKASYLVFALLLFAGTLSIRSVRRVRYILPLLLVFLATGLYYARTTQADNVMSVFLPSVESQSSYSKEGSGRLAIFQSLFTRLSDNPTHLLFGLGTGTVSTNLGGLSESTGALPLEADLGNTTFLPTQVLQTAGEMGVLGMLAGWMILGLVGRMAIVTYQQGNDAFSKAAALITVSFSAVLALGAMTETIWTWQATGTMFWVFAAYVTTQNRKGISPARSEARTGRKHPIGIESAGTFRDLDSSFEKGKL